VFGCLLTNTSLPLPAIFATTPDLARSSSNADQPKTNSVTTIYNILEVMEPRTHSQAAARDMLYLLPPELRSNVYGELFFDKDSTVYINSRELHENRVAVLATSRLYHQEAASYFYSQSHFVFDRPSIPTSEAKILPPIADRYVGHLKQITLNLHAGHTNLPKVRRAAQMIAALIDTGASFDEIRINIGTSLCNFLNLRFDDSIMGANHCITLALQRLFSANVSKRIHIDLDKTWFGPCVADQFESALSTDPSTCERSLVGKYFNDPIVWFGTDPESNSDGDGESSGPPTSPSSLLSLMDLDSDWDNTDDEQDVDNEDQLTSDDDSGLDDLIPLGRDENAKMRMFIHFLPDMI
jgi:hypothetical protein